MHKNRGAVSMKSTGPNLDVPPDGDLPQVQICDSVCGEKWAERHKNLRE